MIRSLPSSVSIREFETIMANCLLLEGHSAPKGEIGKDVGGGVSWLGYAIKAQTPRRSTHGVLRQIRNRQKIGGLNFGSPGQTPFAALWASSHAFSDQLNLLGMAPSLDLLFPFGRQVFVRIGFMVQQGRFVLQHPMG